MLQMASTLVGNGSECLRKGNEESTEQYIYTIFARGNAPVLPRGHRRGGNSKHLVIYAKQGRFVVYT